MFMVHVQDFMREEDANICIYNYKMEQTLF